MPTNYPTVPAVYTARSVTPRNIFKSGTPEYLPSLATIDGTKSRDITNDDITVLRAGTLMGKVTTGGKFRPAIIGILGTATTAATVTSVTVTAAQATEVARLIALAGGNVALKLVGPPTAGGTVASTSITVTAASGTTLTVSSVTTPVIVVGSLIMPADGSQTIVQILPDQYGVSVTDQAGTSQDATLRLVRSGDIDVTQIVGYSSMDTSVQTYVKAALNAVGFFTFSDDANR